VQKKGRLTKKILKFSRLGGYKKIDEKKRLKDSRLIAFGSILHSRIGLLVAILIHPDLGKAQFFVQKLPFCNTKSKVNSASEM
jgi:hypothetical protein